MTATDRASLYVPDVSDDDTLTAALKYAAAGWYVLPVKMSTKHPGSVVGSDWQHKSSRDPEVIVAWFAGTSHGVALHMGRCGALGFDVDTPDNVPTVLVEALRSRKPPFQSTRTTDPRRGHYLFAMPNGRQLGNGTGRLGGAWGEIRGRNGILVVAPSAHENAAQGGRYAWARTGPLPALPDDLGVLLGDAADSADAATDAEVSAFLDTHTDDTRPELLAVWSGLFARKVDEGESRHQRMLSVLAGAMKEARAGYLNARTAADTLQAAFLAAVAQPPKGKQTEPRVGAAALSEWRGLLSWAVAQAKAADLDEVRRRAETKVPDSLAWIPAEQTPLDALLDHVRAWHELDDLAHVLFALSCAVSAHDKGEPLWGMIVGAPSSGKTETVRMLDAVVDDRLDELTAAGLLSWSRHKTPKPVGILSRVGSGSVWL